MYTLKRIFITLFAFILACLLITGCMFRDLKKEIQEEKISFRLYGTIENIKQAENHVYVMLYAQAESKWQLDRSVLPDDDGTYAFLITPGTYMVAGFEDQNANLRHDPGEPAGARGAPDKIVIAEMNDDYLSLSGSYTTHMHTSGPPVGREAPAMFKRRDRVAMTMRKGVEKLLADAGVEVVRENGRARYRYPQTVP